MVEVDHRPFARTEVGEVSVVPVDGVVRPSATEKVEELDCKRSLASS